MRGHPVGSALAPILALGLLWGCGSEEGPSGPVTDLSLDVPAWTGSVVMEIGRDPADGPYLLGQVTGVAVDSEGRVHVADGLAHEVRVFDSDGRFLEAAGGAGSGPGELLRPCCLAVDGEGRLWVRDTGNARYNLYRWYAGALGFVEQRGMVHPDPNFGPRTTFGPDGELVDVGHRVDPASGGRVLVRHHVGASGTVLREDSVPTASADELGAFVVERTSGENRSSFFFYPPFGPGHFVAHGPGGGWATALGSTYRVTWWDALGVPRPEIHVPAAQGAPVGSVEGAEAEARIADQLGSLGVNLSESRFRVPERKPPITGLFFDTAGWLWVERSVGEGEDPRAEVFGPDGRLRARASWPRGVRLRDGVVFRDRAWAPALRDGMPVVVRLSWEEGPGG